MTDIAPTSERPIALIVTPRFLPLLGGMERECALLAEEFKQLGYSPLVITEQLGLDLPLEEMENGVRIVRIPSSPQRSLIVQLRVARTIATLLVRNRRRIAFAVVRTFTLPALVVGLLKLLRLISFPTLVTAETGGDSDDVVELERRPLARLSRKLVSSNDVMNALCQANHDHLVEFGYPTAKLSMIPNGIDTSPWLVTSPPARVRRFLFLGRLERAKGIFELAEAFAQVHSANGELHLTVAGDGPDAGAFAARCDELGIGGAVDLRGRVEYAQIGELFAQTDCLVLPSYSEGMPLSVLEAAAHHRVLVLSDVGDMGRLFSASAQICQPRDVASLTEALRRASEDEGPTTSYDSLIERVGIERVAADLVTRLGT
jgi:glycosyltransferase involved in cell wall biosynthesis